MSTTALLLLLFLTLKAPHETTLNVQIVQPQTVLRDRFEDAQKEPERQPHEGRDSPVTPDALLPPYRGIPGRRGVSQWQTSSDLLP